MTDNVVEQKVELDWVTRLADEVVAEAQHRGRTARSSARRASARRGRSTSATSAS